MYVQFVVERVSLQNQCYDDDSNIKLACINCSMVTHSQIECFSADVESVCVLGGIAERKLSNSGIDDTYHMLTKTLNDCAQKHCPKKRFAKFLKPYWNKELSNDHKIMTCKRSMWIDEGRPKCGSVYHSYKDAKREFRRLHRYHTTQYMLTIDHELDSMAQSNSVNFWKTIKKRKTKQQSFSVGLEFDGVKARDPDRIRNDWANYLIYACRPLSVSLANLYSSMLRASFVPNDLKRGVISTLYKGGNQRRDNPDYYRAITLSSVVFKVFEDIVLR